MAEGRHDVKERTGRMDLTETKNRSSRVAGSSPTSGAIFDVDQREARAKELEARMAGADFWEDPEAAQRVLTELKSLKRITDPFRALSRDVEEAEGMAGLLDEEPDEALATALTRSTEKLLPRIQELELVRILSDESDAHGAILSIHPGAGGPSRRTGPRCSTACTAVHRAHGVELPGPRSSAGRGSGDQGRDDPVDGPTPTATGRPSAASTAWCGSLPSTRRSGGHTSFASVFIYPQAGDGGDVEVKDAEIRIDTFRAGGAGVSSQQTDRRCASPTSDGAGRAVPERGGASFETRRGDEGAEGAALLAPHRRAE